MALYVNVEIWDVSLAEIIDNPMIKPQDKFSLDLDTREDRYTLSMETAKAYRKGYTVIVAPVSAV